MRMTSPHFTDDDAFYDEYAAGVGAFAPSPNAAAQVLAGLNANQRDAVEAIEGPLLIIAGPGSGKTRVITHRIAYLVRVVGITPYRIAAVTFTNKAAREMRLRLSSLLGHAANDLNAATFHAFCASVLRREGEHIGLNRDFAIYDDTDQMALMKRALTELELDPKRFPPRSILSAVSGAKSNLIGAEGFAQRTTSYWDEIVSRAYERYEFLLSQSSAVDFDDLLLKTYQLFEQLPDTAKKYQQRYTHFMVDEFQDTNVAQYAIAKQVASHHQNICVVGDPDQSIYAWRNADIRNILSFQDDYPAAKLIALDQNYRSTQTILDAARSLIAANTQRVDVDKNLWTSNGDGVPIILAEGYNEAEEAQFVIKEIQALVRSTHYAAGDIAVMYRVNAQSRALEEACLRYGVPYQVVGGMKFYQRQEVKDITAYLRLIANPDDDVSLNRVVNVPLRGIGQRTLDRLARIANAAGISQLAAIQAISDGSLPPTAASLSGGFTKRALTALTSFGSLIQSLDQERNELDLLDLIEQILERSGYRRWLMDQDGGEERMENIDEFRASARDYLTLGKAEALTAFLESVSLVADVDSMEERADAITLITLHQAKGLEFPVVFIVGMEEGLLPHSRSLDEPSQIEEERRLCYVGVTRAKERLYLMRAFRRGFRGGSEPGTPSRFLLDIPPELITAPQQTLPQPRRTQRQRSPSSTQRRLTPGAPSRRTKPVNTPSARHDKPRASSTRRTPSQSAAERSRSAREGSARNDRLRRTLSQSTDAARRTPSRRRPAAHRNRDASRQQPAAPAPFAAGDKVRHATFGEGIITECKPSGGDYEATVVFKDGAGIKRLLLSLAPLEKQE